LFAEEMIKLPVLLEEHLDGWDVAVRLPGTGRNRPKNPTTFARSC
jgi:hypothetical protein